MKKILCVIICLCAFVVTGCSSSYERDEESGEVKNITVTELQKMMDKKESFAVVFTQTTCSHCITMHTMLDTYILDHNVLLYEVVLDEAPEADRAAELKQIQRLFVGMKETPTLYYVDEGKNEDELQDITKDRFDSFVQNHRLDEKK